MKKLHMKLDFYAFLIISVCAESNVARLGAAVTSIFLFWDWIKSQREDDTP
jgi:hypothetical protein